MLEGIQTVIFGIKLLRWNIYNEFGDLYGVCKLLPFGLRDTPINH